MPALALSDLILVFESVHYPGLRYDPTHRYIYEWVVNASVVNEDGKPQHEVGQFSFVFVDLDGAVSAGEDIWDLMDAESGDLMKIADEVWDSDRNDLDQELQDRLVGFGSGFLVLDRARVESTYRGQGLGPIIAGLAIERLGRGCHFAACIPAPTERMTENRLQAVGKLERVWSRIGFEHWRSGVWILDLAHVKFERALASLLEPR